MSDIVNYQGEDGILYLLQKIKNKFLEVTTSIGGKVDKVEGKQLSTNDFTDELKNKLVSMSSDANRVDVDQVLNGQSTNPISNAAVVGGLNLKANILDPEFLGSPKAPNVTAGDNSKAIANTAFVKTAITNALINISGIEFTIVETLPVVGDKGKIYLVNNSTDVEKNNYDEYIWVSNEYGYEKIGSSSVDLSGYVKTTDLVQIDNDTLDTLWNAVFNTTEE